MVGAGNWDPLALGGSGGSVFRSNLDNGYQTLVTVADLLTTEPGNMNGPTQSGMNARITSGQSKYPSGTFSNHALDDPRVMTIPIVDFSSINGRSQVPLKGLAKMWVVSVSGKGDISCYFIEESIPNATPDPNASGAYGAVAPALLQ
jgi:hypothetical protein